MTLRQEIVDTIDSQISVKDSFFFRDLRLLGFLPLIPGIIFGLVAAPDNEASKYAFGLGLVACVPWIIFLFKRRQIKKSNWIEPTRFSDDQGPY
jgi:hypothetical protein